MISASTLNSELINKIAQDFAQATSLAVVVVNIHGVLPTHASAPGAHRTLSHERPLRRAGRLEK